MAVSRPVLDALADGRTQVLKPVLLSLIRGVRTRWRWKVVLRSLTVLLGAGVGTIVVAAYGLEQFRFSPPAIITARIVTYLVLAGLGWFFFVRPLARRVTDQQVALYLEEHEPSLQELLLSAVDAGSAARTPRGERPVGGHARAARRVGHRAVSGSRTSAVDSSGAAWGARPR